MITFLVYILKKSLLIFQSLRQEIERRLKRTQEIKYEPVLLSPYTEQMIEKTFQGGMITIIMISPSVTCSSSRCSGLAIYENISNLDIKCHSLTFLFYIVSYGVSSYIQTLVLHISLDI